MNEMEHGQHMEQMKAGLAQILDIAKQMGVEPIVQIAEQLLSAEQAEQTSEQPKAFADKLAAAKGGGASNEQ